MKILLSIIIIFFSSFFAFGQIEAPVKWSYVSKKVEGLTYDVFIKASIQEGWHVYSAYQKDGGPSKTEVNFNLSDATLLGKLREPQPIVKFEKVFGIDVCYFNREVVFRQRIKVKKLPAKIAGTINYMTCNDQKCRYPDPVAFSITIK